MRPLFEKLLIPDGQSWTFLHRRLADGIPFQWHYHREYELTLTLNSRGQRYVGDDIGPYADGDLVLLGPNIPHTWASAEKMRQELPHVALVIWFKPDWIDALVAGSAELSPVASMLATSHRGIQFSERAAEAVRPAIEGLAELERPKRLLRLLDILVTLSEDQGPAPLTSPQASPSAFPTEDRPRVERVLDHLHSHYRDQLRIEDLAELAHLSASGLHRMFKRHTRLTISEYLSQLRIGQACQLLINTDGPISHVAEMAGYENLSHFNRQFRRARGETPRDFRRTFRHPPSPRLVEP